MSFAFLILKDIIMIKWKEIKGLDGRYLVSNEGKIKNSETGRIIKTKFIWTGYERVGLRKNNKPVYFLVHRLVLMAFHPIEVIGKLQVNHKNKKRSDNRIENLEWVTIVENLKHRHLFEKEVMLYQELFLLSVNKLIPF